MMISRMLSVLALTLAAPLADAMRVAPGRNQSMTSLGAFREAWDAHVARVEKDAEPQGLQELCRPMRKAHEGEYAGVAVLIHGFSACPDQYHQMAPLLAKAGYEVLMVLMPGHGTAQPSEDHPIRGKCSPLALWPCDPPFDDSTRMPVSSSEYVSFVEEINGIVRKAPSWTSFGDAVNVLAGFSFGGAVAAYAGQASLDRDSTRPLYQRQFILNGFFALHDWKQRALIRFLGSTVLKNAWTGWGDMCENDRKNGRFGGSGGGICDYQLKNMRAATSFGRDTLKNMKVLGAGTKDAPDITVVYSHNDKAVSNAITRKLVKKYSDKKVLSSSCVLPFTSHNVLGKYVADDAGKAWWGEPLLCRAAAFLTHGVPFKLSEDRFGDEGNVNACDLGCDPATCPEPVFSPDETAGEVTCKA